MPSFPELRYGFGEKRSLEVFRQPHSENLPAADDKIHGPRKIHVKLNGVPHRRHGKNKAVVILIVGKDIFDHQVQAIRNNDFFHKAEKDPLQAEREIPVLQLRGLPKLRGRFRIAADRALHDLREKAHKERHTQKIAVGRDLSPVYVKNVGHRLQCVK